METQRHASVAISELLHDIENREGSALGELWKVILSRQNDREAVSSNVNLSAASPLHSDEGANDLEPCHNSVLGSDFEGTPSAPLQRAN